MSEENRALVTKEQLLASIREAKTLSELRAQIRIMRILMKPPGGCGGEILEALRLRLDELTQEINGEIGDLEVFLMEENSSRIIS